MTAATKFEFATTKIALWMSKNPTATRLALIVLPVVVAVAFALMTHTSVYACPAGSSGGGGCR